MLVRPHRILSAQHLISMSLALVSLGAVEAATAAQEVRSTQVKGAATVALVRGRCRDDVPRDSKVLEKALLQAKLAAIRAYTSSFSLAKQKVYQAVAPTVEESPDQYLTNVMVIDQRCDTSTKVFRIVVRGLLDRSALEHLMNENVPSMDSGEGSMFVAIFLARRATSVTEYAENVFARADVDSVSIATESAAISGGTVQASEEAKASKSVRIGGSATQKADAISYEVSRPRDLEDSANGVLSSAGFEVIDAAEVVVESGGVFDLEQFTSDFSTADDISPETRALAYGVLRDFEIPLFAMGTLDIGIKDVDPVSGNTRVFVSVAARVYDLTKRFARTVASVGPVQYSGLGSSQTVAERNALLLAAEAAASEIVVQLQAKGIR